MNKRKCGTCRFFQDGGLAGSGWCHHPARRVSRDAMIMVRKGELACRNGWNDDYWTAADAGDGGSPLAASDRFPIRPVPPASADEIAAVMMMRADEPEPAPPRPVEDVLVGQKTVMPDVDDRALILAQDTREAIRQARERHLAKANARPPDVAAADEEAPGALADATSAGALEPPLRSQPLRPAARDLGDGAPRGFGAERPERERDGDGARELAARRERAAIARTETPAVVPPTLIGRSRRPADDVAPTGERSRQVAEADRRAVEPEPDRRPERAARPDVPVPDYGNAWRARTWRERDRVEQRAEQRAEPAPPFDPPTIDEPDETSVPLVAEAAPAPAIADIAGYAELDVGFDDAEPIDMTIQIAPDVPRMCRTCRDFRPADSGDRGWCTSRWAFSHRRMVNADDLTCDSSLGCWWLPHDDVWLSTIDISAHGQPTPLLDNWLSVNDAAGGGSGRR